MNMRKIHDTKNAFTLIETFVAISILLIALVGPLSLAEEALKSAYYARDEVTAFYLAQEGLEYAEAVRDQQFIANTGPWLGNLETTCIYPNICEIDFPNFTASTCVPGGNPPCDPLLIDSNGLFEYASKSDTTVSPFTRTLTVIPVASDEVRVSVTVTWVSVGISRSFTLSEHLFDWQML